MHSVKLAQFEGPLGALLELIEAEKLDITQIALAKVTESYLQLIEKNDDIAPEDLADFLVVASKLLLIKSKYLLPFLVIDSAEEEIRTQSTSSE